MANGAVYEHAAKSLIEASGSSRSLKPVLRKHCPWIADQIRQSARSREWLDLWGKSLNFDENAGQEIVAPEILRLIGDLAGVPMRGKIFPAGLMHTYGYLFSLIDTPFGKKRDRWIEPELDQGFGWKTPTLRDQPSHGTLLLNLTFALGQIAFCNQPELLECLFAEENVVSPELRNYAFDELTITRLVEQATIDEGRRKGTVLTIHTDLVQMPFARKTTGQPNTLLVYSLFNGPRLGHQLITAFSVTQQFVDETCAAGNMGKRVAIRPRFNAYVEGLTGRVVSGRRSIVD